MFSLIQTTPVGGDCTSGYRVNLDKEYTLQEFIDDVLTIKGEWGGIRIVKRDCDRYSYPVIRYRYGKITNEPNLPKMIYGYKVKSVFACGGWSNMDYVVMLEKEVN